jgi:hypothetical protein
MLHRKCSPSSFHNRKKGSIMNNDSPEERRDLEKERIRDICMCAFKLLESARRNIILLRSLANGAKSNEEYINLRREANNFISECRERLPDGITHMSASLRDEIASVDEIILRPCLKEIDRYIQEAYTIGEMATKTLARRRREQK